VFNDISLLPESQFISSLEDTSIFKQRDNELSQALKKRRLPRQQKLISDINLLLGNNNE